VEGAEGGNSFVCLLFNGIRKGKVGRIGFEREILGELGVFVVKFVCEMVEVGGEW
jgi:hypothetical protein